MRRLPCLLFLVCTAAAALAGQGSPSGALILLTREGRTPLPTSVENGQEMVALDDLASAFQFTVREDTLARAITVAYKGKTIVLGPEQTIASVAGRLVSLASPPVRSGRRWLVPIEFISRALALIYDVPIDVRRGSRLVIVGGVRVPRVSVRYEVAGALVRIALDTAPPAPIALSQDGARLSVRFDADVIDPALPPLPAQATVVGARVDPPIGLTFELGPRVQPYRATGDPASGRVVVELAPAETEPAPGLAPKPVPIEPPPLIASPTSAIRTIVIDPGHGGDEQGAKGPGGMLEKDVALLVARRLKTTIEGRLGIRVLLSRDDDRTVGLDERAALANNNKADVFLSLHANASPRSAARGAEIFYSSLDRAGDEARKQAESEGQRLPVFGGETREIELILWEMAQARYIEQSAALAAIVEEQMRGRVEMSARPVQQAPFRVLVGANMPAVLVEMGYITNPAQEQQLAGAEFQNAFVAAIYDAILRFRDYLEQGAPGRTAQPARQP